MRNLIRVLICCLFMQAQVFAGASLDLPNNTDYINIGNPATFNNLAPMSIGAWINSDTSGGGGQASIVFKRGNPASSGWKFGLSIALGGSLQFILDAGTDLNLISQNRYVHGGWRFVAMTWDGTFNAGNAHLYVSSFSNTQIVEPVYVTAISGVGPRVSDEANPMTIGTNGTLVNQGLDGRIAYVKISSAVWTLNDLYNVMNCADFVPINLVGAWSMTDDYSQNDLSGVGNRGAHVGSPVVSSEGPPTNFCNQGGSN